jgi:hypothetical protein
MRFAIFRLRAAQAGVRIVSSIGCRRSRSGLDGRAGRGFKEPIMGPAIPEPPPENDETRVIERPDGFYWRSDTTGEEHGPFRTLAEAVEDMGFDAESADYEPDETVEEAEAEIGLSGWIDPDTGDLGESWTPRLEDH